MLDAVTPGTKPTDTEHTLVAVEMVGVQAPPRRARSAATFTVVKRLQPSTLDSARHGAVRRVTLRHLTRCRVVLTLNRRTGPGRCVGDLIPQIRLQHRSAPPVSTQYGVPSPGAPDGGTHPSSGSPAGSGE
jgi:hypothetical protein